MSLFKIITPEATTNMGANPSLETAVTQWTAFGSGASVARDNTEAAYGRYSLKVTSGTSSLGGAYYYTAASGISVGTGTQYTASIYCYNGTGDIQLALVDDGDVVLGSTSVSSASAWQRAEVTATTGGTSSSVHVRITNDADTTSQVFYVDAVQVEQKAAATTYCDGDQEGCFWDGQHHASTSQREAFGVGGAIKSFSDLHASLVDLDSTGMGMPPVLVNQQPFAKLPGSTYEDTVVRGRVANLIVHAGNMGAGNLTTLHQIREALLDAVKLDRVSSPTPFRLQYVAATNTVYSDFLYEGGLEESEKFGFTETIPMRLFGPDPFWYEDRQEIAITDYEDSVARDYVLARIDGAWTFPGTGADDEAYAVAVSPEGVIYYGGKFTSLDAASNTANIARIVNGSVQALNAGVGTGTVYAIAVAPDETVYAAGDFVAVDNGTAANNIASWSESGGWATLGTGLNGTARALAIGLDGTLYAGGQFTSPGTRLASWDGSSWSAMGTGVDATVRALAVAPDGDLFVGGDFTNYPGGTSSHIVEFDVGDSTFAKVGGNGQFNGTSVNALAFAPDGRLYAGGDFTTASGNTVNRVAEWGGSDWLPMESGLDDTVNGLAWIDGDLWIAGAFNWTSAAEAIPIPALAIWNGSTFVRPDLELNSFLAVYAVAGKKADVYIAHAAVNSHTVGVKTSVTNSGSAAAYPILVVTGPASLKWIENHTTGDRLYFNLDIVSGEEITFDFRPHKKSIRSNWRNYAIQPRRGSDFGTFRLLPGTNELVVYLLSWDSPTEVHFRWRVTHWSLDGAA